jgi:hypothetical protein
MRKALLVGITIVVLILVVIAVYRVFPEEDKEGLPQEFIVPGEDSADRTEEDAEGKVSEGEKDLIPPADETQSGVDQSAPGTAPQPVDVPVPTPPPIPNQTTNMTPPTTPTPTPPNATPPGGPYPPPCSDSVWNGDESDLDCGGLCAPCLSTGIYTSCWVNSDCASNNCNMTGALPLPATDPADGSTHSAYSSLRVLAGQSWIIPYQGTCS